MILYRDVAAFLILYQEALIGVLGRSFFYRESGIPFPIHYGSISVSITSFTYDSVSVLSQNSRVLKCRGPVLDG